MAQAYHLFQVMDEADRLLDMDFGPIIDKILKVIPKERTTYLFSATMTTKVAKLQRASLTNPVRVEVSKKYVEPFCSGRYPRSQLSFSDTKRSQHYCNTIYLSHKCRRRPILCTSATRLLKTQSLYSLALSWTVNGCP